MISMLANIHRERLEAFYPVRIPIFPATLEDNDAISYGTWSTRLDILTLHIRQVGRRLKCPAERRLLQISVIDGI
jgi:hypothetical protein